MKRNLDTTLELEAMVPRIELPGKKKPLKYIATKFYFC